MKLQILHLSDLHVSENQKGYLEPVAAGLQRDLAKLREEGIAPHFVFITGDIINKGENAAAEFALAKELFIDPVLKTTELSTDRLVMIPGNHEVDRTRVVKHAELGFGTDIHSQESFRKFYEQTAVTSSNFAPYRDKLAAFFDFKGQFLNTHQKRNSFYVDTYVVPKNGITVGIAALNTAWRSSQHGSDEKRLLIGEHLIQEVAQQLKTCDVRICLAHHPFEMLTEWDGKPVERKVAKHFHLLLNGHVHDSNANSVQLLYGGRLLTSTAGCLRPTEPFASYSVLDWNLPSGEIHCQLRKWYPQREEFDQETEKCAEGRITFSGFYCNNETGQACVEIGEIRGALQTMRSHPALVVPMDGIDEVRFRDVFVEPVISDTTSFERNAANRKTFSLPDLIRSDANFIFVGRGEYGKTWPCRDLVDRS